ncbi:MAG: hypothetical protein NT011_04620 [Kiritimatiellaeota bacterium]|nr:hypothetical protein [Kiritimatiellota bacterium]
MNQWERITVVCAQGTRWVPMVLFMLSLGLTLGFHGKAYDDAYITYRCARHLTEGHGLSYNIGEAISATTTPLLAILLAGLGRWSSPEWIPAWGGVLSGLSLFALTGLIWMHARRENQVWVGMVAVAWLFTCPFLETVWGGESLLALALSLGAFYLYFEHRHALAAVLCFLAFLTRGEGLIPFGVMVAHKLWKEKRIAWEMIGIFVLMMMAWWFVAPRLGTSFMPKTLAVKMAQMQSGAWGPFVKTTLDWYRAYLIGSPAFPGIRPHPIWAMLPLLAVGGGLAWLVRPSERWGWILLWLALYVAGYSILAVPFYTWYSFPIFLAVALLAGIGHQGVVEGLARLRRIPASLRIGMGWGYGLFLLLAFGVGAQSVIQSMWAPPSPAQRLYTRAGLWLRANSAPAASVGFFEIGFVGYYSDRRMVDPVGLVNPDVVPHVARGDFTWALRHYQPDYIVLTPVRWQDRIGRIRDENDFKAHYELVAALEEPGYFDSPLAIYKKSAHPPPGL